MRRVQALGPRFRRHGQYWPSGSQYRRRMLDAWWGSSFTQSFVKMRRIPLTASAVPLDCIGIGNDQRRSDCCRNVFAINSN